MTLNTIKKVIENYYDVNLIIRNRHTVYVEARQMYSYFSRLLTHHSYQRIAEEIGYNHANIMHHEQKAKDYRQIDQIDSNFKHRMNEIRELLENAPEEEEVEKKINYHRLYNAKLLEYRIFMRKYQKLLKKNKRI